MHCKCGVVARLWSKDWVSWVYSLLYSIFVSLSRVYFLKSVELLRDCAWSKDWVLANQFNPIDPLAINVTLNISSTYKVGRYLVDFYVKDCNFGFKQASFLGQTVDLLLKMNIFKDKHSFSLNSPALQYLLVWKIQWIFVSTKEKATISYNIILSATRAALVQYGWNLSTNSY